MMDVFILGVECCPGEILAQLVQIGYNRLDAQSLIGLISDQSYISQLRLPPDCPGSPSRGRLLPPNPIQSIPRPLVFSFGQRVIASCANALQALGFWLFMFLVSITSLTGFESVPCK